MTRYVPAASRGNACIPDDNQLRLSKQVSNGLDNYRGYNLNAFRRVLPTGMSLGFCMVCETGFRRFRQYVNYIFPSRIVNPLSYEMRHTFGRTDDLSQAWKSCRPGLRRYFPDKPRGELEGPWAIRLPVRTVLPAVSMERHVS